jgi:hypothetical protein
MGVRSSQTKVMLLLLFLPLASALQNIAVVPFSLSISARNASVRAGHSVVIDVRLQNTTKHTISVYEAVSEDMDQSGWVYRVNARAEDGQSPPQTEYARKIGARR